MVNFEIYKTTRKIWPNFRNYRGFFPLASTSKCDYGVVDRGIFPVGHGFYFCFRIIFHRFPALCPHWRIIFFGFIHFIIVVGLLFYKTIVVALYGNLHMRSIRLNWFELSAAVWMVVKWYFGYWIEAIGSFVFCSWEVNIILEEILPKF